jgi:hypothetical protein
MYTADMARKGNMDELDARIEAAVKDRDAGPNAAYLRVYIEDSFCQTIGEELERRGFKNVQVPDICLKGDVYFEW